MLIFGKNIKNSLLRIYSIAILLVVGLMAVFFYQNCGSGFNIGSNSSSSQSDSNSNRIIKSGDSTSSSLVVMHNSSLDFYYDANFTNPRNAYANPFSLSGDNFYAKVNYASEDTYVCVEKQKDGAWVLPSCDASSTDGWSNLKDLATQYPSEYRYDVNLQTWFININIDPKDRHSLSRVIRRDVDSSGGVTYVIFVRYQFTKNGQLQTGSTGTYLRFGTPPPPVVTTLSPQFQFYDYAGNPINYPWFNYLSTRSDNKAFSFNAKILNSSYDSTFLCIGIYTDEGYTNVLRSCSSVAWINLKDAAIQSPDIYKWDGSVWTISMSAAQVKQIFVAALNDVGPSGQAFLIALVGSSDRPQTSSGAKFEADKFGIPNMKFATNSYFAMFGNAPTLSFSEHQGLLYNDGLFIKLTDTSEDATLTISVSPDMGIQSATASVLGTANSSLKGIAAQDASMARFDAARQSWTISLTKEQFKSVFSQSYNENIKRSTDGRVYYKLSVSSSSSGTIYGYFDIIP